MCDEMKFLSLYIMVIVKHSFVCNNLLHRELCLELTQSLQEANGGKVITFARLFNSK